MSIYITTEATADYPDNLLADNMAIIPMGYSVNGVAYDGCTQKLTPKQFYDVCRNAKSKEDLPQTAMVTAYAAQEFFRPLLEAGHDIVHIGFASALSGTLDQLNAAARELREQFPDRKIAVIDSRCACFVEGLLVYHTMLKRNEGASFDELVAYAEQLRDQCIGYFVVDDLKHLMRTGRTSRAAAYIGEALQIKPLLYINREGQLVPIAKAISRKKAIRTLVSYFTQKALPLENQPLVAVGHADCPDDAQALVELLRNEYGVANTIVFDVGPVIGTHVGAGMLALVALGKDKIEPNDPAYKA